MRMIKLNRPHLMNNVGEINLIYRLIHQLHNTKLPGQHTAGSSASHSDSSSSFKSTNEESDHISKKFALTSTPPNNNTDVYIEKQEAQDQTNEPSYPIVSEVDCRPKVYPLTV